MTPAHEPLVVVLAGPNGAGKSTSARRLLQGAYAVSKFVNADTIARVAERVRRGGHSVPPATVRRRYFAGLRNFFGLYQSVADSWQLYDSSTPSPRLVASRNASAGTVVLDVRALAALEQHR